MTDKLFDSFISNKLKNYESPVPNGLWDKIIEKEEKRKPAIFWWWNKSFLLVGLAILFTSFGVSYYFITQKNSLSGINDTSNLLAHKTTKSNVEGKNEEIIIQNKTTSELAETIASNDAADAKNKEYNIKEKSDIKTIISHASDIKNVVKGNKNSLENILDKEQNESASVLNSNYFSNKKPNTSASNFSSNKKNTLKFFKKKGLKSGRTSNNDVNNAEQEFGFDNSEYLKNKSFNANTILDENELYNTRKLAITKALDFKKLFIGTDDCPTTRGTFRNDLYIEGYTSPDIAFKKLSENTSGNTNYLSKKDSSETMTLGFTIGARFSKSISNNLLVKAGLQYSQFNEKFTLRTENDRRQTIVINEHTIIRPGQADTTISDTSISLQIGYRVRSNINRYKNLEIPLMLSYEMSKPESNLQLSLNAGAIVNVMSWYEGKTIDANYNPITVGSKSNSNIYKSQVGISLYGGLCISRRIDEQIAVFAEPYFRYGISNSLQSTTGFTQKFNVFGLQFGARLKINKNKHL